MTRRVGILAIQGDVQAHARALEHLGAEVAPVLFASDLERIDALVLPGGESTTISKGLDRLGLREPLAEKIRAGLPVLGTCAGAILLAREVRNHPVPVLGTMDVIAVRNAYGTQVDSFAAPVDADSREDLKGLRCVFIRAPRLERPGPEVEVLARVDGQPVLLRQGHMIAATFHPELTADGRVHALLLDGH
ncbi:MAG: pyridoxal 5'-phosphate synthase glutaminase subunit PdxT [Gammaproteobacteria bacterium]|nr:pyridoxal 5'-phosphate synthase glutaminase subunit PdxT [Gammaproteobacteria bacterium]